MKGRKLAVLLFAAAVWIPFAAISVRADDTQPVVQDQGGKHVWDNGVWTWTQKADGSWNAYVTLTCQNDGETELVAGSITEEEQPATCQQAGSITYTASALFDGVTYTDQKTVEGEPKTDTHAWDEGTWTWKQKADGSYRAYVTLTCQDCGKTQLVAGTVTAAEQEATCTQPAGTVYSATAVFDGKTYTSSKEVTTSEASGHQLANPVWTWSEDYQSASVTLTCSVCGEQVTENAVVTSQELMPATCTQNGKIRYTAKVDNGNGGWWVDQKTVITEEAHQWENPVWTWSDDHTQATVTLTCSKCGTTKDIQAQVTEQIIQPATCTQTGKVKHFANAVDTDGSSWVDWKTDTIEQTAHSYGNPVWTWSDDHTEASVKLTCSVCGATKEIQAEVSERILRPATCTQTGKVRHFAKAVDESGTWVDWKTDTIEQTAHSYSNPVWTWSDDHTEASVKLTCSVCGATKEIQAEVSERILRPATCTQTGKVRHFAKAVDDSGTWVDWKTDTIEQTAHSYSNPVWTWSDDHTEASVKLTCSVCGATKEIQAEVSEQILQPATCTQTGKVRHFAKAADDDGSTWVDWKTDTIEQTAHSYGNPVWTWSDDHTEASVKLTCSVCGATKDIQAEVSERILRPATCTQTGKVRHFAKAADDDGSTWVDWKTDTIEQTAHSYGNPVWTWSDDHTKASVKLTCSVCGATKEIQAEVSEQILRPATCTQTGKVRHFAKAADDDGSTWVDWKTDTIEMTAHSYGNPVWTWSDDYSSASAAFTCSLCGNTETVDAVVTKDETPAGCLTDGKTVYTASVSYNGTDWTDTKEVKSADALGHSYGSPAWTWNEDHTKAYAEFTCQNDPDHTLTLEADAVYTVTKAATSTEEGEGTYTASVTAPEGYAGEDEQLTAVYTVTIPRTESDTSTDETDTSTTDTDTSTTDTDTSTTDTTKIDTAADTDTSVTDTAAANTIKQNMPLTSAAAVSSSVNTGISDNPLFYGMTLIAAAAVVIVLKRRHA
jgi:hypothetical protein